MAVRGDPAAVAALAAGLRSESGAGVGARAGHGGAQRPRAPRSRPGRGEEARGPLLASRSGVEGGRQR